MLLRGIRAVVALVAIAALAWLGYANGRRALDRAEWADVSEGETQSVLTSSHDFPEALSLKARLREGALFPPDLGGAELLASRALVADPWNSPRWLDYARIALFRGQPEKARVALQYSEKLDPNFPVERLRAVPLFVLLGERARALELARGISRFGGSAARASARSLIESGFSSDEVFRELFRADMPPEDLALLIEGLRSRDELAIRRVLVAAPKSAYGNPEFRRRAIQLALDPLQARVATAIWLGRDLGTGDALPELRSLSGSEGNIDLSEDPFGPSLSDLGWQRPTPGLVYQTEWFPPTREAKGSLRLTYPGYTGKGREMSRWMMYRVPLPRFARITISLEVMAEPPGSSEVTLVVTGRGLRSASKPLLLSGAQWHRVEVVIPASKDPNLGEILLERTAATESLGALPRLEVRDLRIGFEEVPVGGS